MFGLTYVTETFLPFSLLHTRADQYRFATDLDVGPASGCGTAFASRVVGSAHPEYVFAGYHEQAILDAACSHIASSQPEQSGGNVTRCDPAPVYDSNLILELLRACVSDEQYLSYAKVVSEHKITPAVGTADGVRAELIRHLFSGGCLLQKGIGCKEIVSGEVWPQSVGIRMIDLTSQWLDSGSLTSKDMGKICHALELVPSATKQTRSLLSKLANRRRSLVLALDMANMSIPETVQNLGSTSTLATVRATCIVHDLPTSQDDTKVDLVDRIIEHVTHGNCAEKHAPGCDQLLKEASPSVQDVVHMQLSVLQCIKGLLSTRQLQKILDLHGIAHEEHESKRKLKSHLTKFMRTLENGKVKQADVEQELLERLQKLEEI